VTECKCGKECRNQTRQTFQNHSELAEHEEEELEKISEEEETLEGEEMLMEREGIFEEYDSLEMNESEEFELNYLRLHTPTQI